MVVVQSGSGSRYFPQEMTKVLAPLMALSVSFLPVIVAGLDHRLGWPPEFPLWLIVLGFLLISLGYAFAAWALAENRFFTSVVRIQVDRGHVVCDCGPYRILRHPGYRDYARRVSYRLIPGIY